MVDPHQVRPSPVRAIRQLGIAFVAMLLMLTPVAVPAHSFSAAIVTDSNDGGAELQSTLEGFLLATRERDGHADETSDGHLGGLDVHVLPLEVASPAAFARLWEEMETSADILLVAGSDDLYAAAVQAVGAKTAVLRPGRLPPEDFWKGITGADKSEFAIRYHNSHKRLPDRAAAAGYNAARRIDLAIRPLGVVDDQASLRAALAATSNGITW